MRFVFRLEAPLRLARHHEESARRELGRAIGDLEKRRHELAALQQELESETRAQEAPRRGEIWIQGQNLFLDWTLGQHGRIARGRDACRSAESAVEQARSVLAERRRAVEVFERLRLRRLTQWKLEQSRRELAEGSDVAGRRWMAQRRSEGRTIPG